MIEHGRKTVFVDLLSALGIKYTKGFTEKFFREHPYKNTFYGISKMLSDYGVRNAGVKIEDKSNDIYNIELPCVAQLGGSFVVVLEVIEGWVVYSWEGLRSMVPMSSFCDSWSGYTLLVEKQEASKEPNYKKNKQLEYVQIIQKMIVWLCLISSMIYMGYSSPEVKSVAFIINILLSSIGLYTCYLILLKKMHVYNKYSDKVCSLLKEQECNNILESEAANFMGIIGLGEIGFGYFLANLVTLLCFPQFCLYLPYINLCSLPFTIWSVWFQRFKAKQWCILCLTVLLVLWLTFFTNLLGGMFVPLIVNQNILYIGLGFIFTIVCTNIVSSKISQIYSKQDLEYELNSIKANVEVFNALIKDQPRFAVYKSTSNILLGNKDAQILITILTNPHCEPCAKMHLRIKKLLLETDNLCVQYIFSSFDPSLDSSNKFLIGSYLKLGKHKAEEIMDKWYSGGKNNKDSFMKNYPTINLDSNAVGTEFIHHSIWKKTTKLQTTPTILVNGIKLPDNYKVEDLKYFSKIGI